MPSGPRAGSSGRSGGGSHFGRSSGGSGGSHFNRGSRSSSSGTHGILRGRTGTRMGVNVIFIGRHHYMAPKSFNKLNTLLIFFFVSLFFVFILSVMSISYDNDLNIIKNDYLHYHQMIRDAQRNPSDLQIVGKIENRKKLENVDKWYLVYSFKADDGSTVYGYTYSIYTWDEIKNFQIGGDILLAVESWHTNFNSDSVNMDFINFSVEDDGEYITLNRNKKLFTAFAIIVGIGSGALLTATIYYATKQLKKAEEQDARALQENTPTVKHCAYCGSILEESENTCKNCGASQSIKK